MLKVSQKTDFTGHKVYVGLDSHLKNWDISIYLDDCFFKSIHHTPDPKQLEKYLKSNFPGAYYKAAYEAGFCGFWIQRNLTRLGIECIVVNAGDVPQTDKAQKSKNDRVDSRRIASFLQAGKLEAIYVPDEQMEAERRLVRFRKTNHQDLIRARMRIRSELHLQGIEIPEKYKGWSKAFIEWIRGLDIKQETWRYMLNESLNRAEQLRAQQLSLNRALRRLIKNDRYREMGELLVTAPGIGMITAINILTEIHPIGRFEKFDDLNSFVGLCPTEHSTGDKEKKGKITPRKQKSLREYLIEAAWVSIRTDPALLKCYTEYQKRMSKKRAIIRIARKLLNRIYVVMKYKRPYQKGYN